MKRASLGVIAVAALLAWSATGEQARAQASLTSGLFDIGNNEVVIQCPDYNTAENVAATLTARIAQGRNGGTWNGLAGITSNSVTSNFYGSPQNNGYTGGSAYADFQNWGTEYTEVGVLVNGDLTNAGLQQYTTFGGVPVNSNSVLMRYTYAGDATLDGVVDANDYAMTDFSYAFGFSPTGASPPGYLGGDFTYQGYVDANSYSDIDFDYVFQGPPLLGTTYNGNLKSLKLSNGLSSVVNAALADVGAKGEATDVITVQVPEPGAVAMFLCGAACLAFWGVRKRKL